MLISDVLGPLPKKVHAVRPLDTIADTVDVLAEYDIGAVIVTTDGRTINGIISERDVVKHLARELEGTLRVRVEDLMTTTVETCAVDDEIEVVMASMVQGHFRHMPVLDDHNSIFGIVSLGDLAEARLSDLQAQNRLLRELTTT